MPEFGVELVVYAFGNTMYKLVRKFFLEAKSLFICLLAVTVPLFIDFYILTLNVMIDDSMSKVTGAAHSVRFARICIMIYSASYRYCAGSRSRVLSSRGDERSHDQNWARLFHIRRFNVSLSCTSIGYAQHVMSHDRDLTEHSPSFNLFTCVFS